MRPASVRMKDEDGNVLAMEVDVSVPGVIRIGSKLTVGPDAGVCLAGPNDPVVGFALEDMEDFRLIVRDERRGRR